MQDATCVGRALEPGARTWTGIPGLDAAAGPMDVPLAEATVSDNGGRDVRRRRDFRHRRDSPGRAPWRTRPPSAMDGGFASRAPLGAIARGSLGPGAARVATLTLNVAATEREKVTPEAMARNRAGVYRMALPCAGLQAVGRGV